MNDNLKILCGDALEKLRGLPGESVQCCVTSPPYWGLRDYKMAGQLGMEKTPQLYVAALTEICAEVKRVLKSDGTFWLNLGDSYFGSVQGFGDTKSTNKNHSGSSSRTKPKWNDCGLKPKDLCMIPFRVAFALQSAGWYLRRDIIWSKPNPMPESVTDRCTSAHEYIFMLTKSPKYFYDSEAIKEPGVWNLDGTGTDKRAERAQSTHKAMPTAIKNGIRPRTGLTGGSYHPPGQSAHSNARTDKQRGHSRKHAGFKLSWDAMEKSEQCSGMRNKRSVWEIATHPYPEAHFATYPPALIKPCILAGSRVGDTILDPFGGSGTTGMVALELGRKAILCELNPSYVELIKQRTNITPGLKFA